MAGFASTADRTVSFDESTTGCSTYTAEGDPGPGVIAGEDGVVMVDAQATPAVAQDAVRRIAVVTDRRVTQVALSHYHAARALGAWSFNARAIIAPGATPALIVERGRQDVESEIKRFPRLLHGRGSVPGPSGPTHSSERETTLRLGGGRRAQAIRTGSARTSGGTVVCRRAGA